MKRAKLLFLASFLAISVLSSGCSGSDLPDTPEAFSALGATLRPSDYGLEESVIPVMVNAAVVGEGYGPWGMRGPIVDVLWTRPIDAATFPEWGVVVGGRRPSEVWVDERDLFITHLLFDPKHDEIGGTVRLTETVFDIWGNGVDSNEIEAGFAGDKAHLLPFKGLKSGPPAAPLTGETDSQRNATATAIREETVTSRRQSTPPTSIAEPVSEKDERFFEKYGYHRPPFHVGCSGTANLWQWDCTPAGENIGGISVKGILRVMETRQGMAAAQVQRSIPSPGNRAIFKIRCPVYDVLLFEKPTEHWYLDVSSNARTAAKVTVTLEISGNYVGTWRWEVVVKHSDIDSVTGPAC